VWFGWLALQFGKQSINETTNLQTMNFSFSAFANFSTLTSHQEKEDEDDD
jgi:hypothetical protein